jgi:hypothetical protein
MSQPRKASQVMDTLPWESRLVALILIQDGTITFANGATEKREIARQAAAKGGTLLAAWPGQHSQDIFLVDDLEAACEYLELSAPKASALRTQRYLRAVR